MRVEVWRKLGLPTTSKSLAVSRELAEATSNRLERDTASRWLPKVEYEVMSHSLVHTFETYPKISPCTPTA